MKTWQKYAAEFFGALILVGVGTGTILGAASMGEPILVAMSMAFGFAWIAGLYTFGRVSGGYFNPALTFAAFLDRRISIQDMLGYWVAQFMGAIGASLIFAWALSSEVAPGRAQVAITYTHLSPIVGELTGFLAEAIFTMVLVAAFLVLAKSRAHTKYLGMGFTLSALIFIGFAFTGASMNPARSLAPALVGDVYGGLWVFFVGPMVGAVLGWVLYKFVVIGDTDLTDDFADIKDSVT